MIQTTKRKNSAVQRRNDRNTKQGESKTQHSKEFDLARRGKIQKKTPPEERRNRPHEKHSSTKNSKEKGHKGRAWQSTREKRPIGRYVTTYITTRVHPGGLHNRQEPAGAGRSSHVSQTHAKNGSTGAGVSAP